MNKGYTKVLELWTGNLDPLKAKGKQPIPYLTQTKKESKILTSQTPT